jgi:hypothetical protein
MEDNGWGEYKREILYRLADLKEDIESLCEDVAKVKAELDNIKVKSGIWGALGASLPIALGILYQLVK